MTYKAFAKWVKQHEFTPQDLWLFLPGGYPLNTDIEVKRLEFVHFHWLREWGKNFGPITKIFVGILKMNLNYTAYGRCSVLSKMTVVVKTRLTIFELNSKSMKEIQIHLDTLERV